jgi:hypothetical protein
MPRGQIDEPKFKLSIRQNQLPNISGFYYMRLRGTRTMVAARAGRGSASTCIQRRARPHHRNG